MIAFEIPYPATKRGKAAWNKRFGLNAYYAGKHWSQRKKDAEELHTLAHWVMRKAGITKRLVNHPVKVTFFWNDNLDIDNHGALGKPIVDVPQDVLEQAQAEFDKARSAGQEWNRRNGIKLKGSVSDEKMHR